jgi:hypothetical protein
VRSKPNLVVVYVLLTFNSFAQTATIDFATIGETVNVESSSNLRKIAVYGECRADTTTAALTYLEHYFGFEPEQIIGADMSNENKLKEYDLILIPWFANSCNYTAAMLNALQAAFDNGTSIIADGILAKSDNYGPQAYNGFNAHVFGFNIGEGTVDANLRSISSYYPKLDITISGAYSNTHYIVPTTGTALAYWVDSSLKPVVPSWTYYKNSNGAVGIYLDIESWYMLYHKPINGGELTNYINSWADTKKYLGYIFRSLELALPVRVSYPHGKEAVWAGRVDDIVPESSENGNLTKFSDNHVPLTLGIIPLYQSKDIRNYPAFLNFLDTMEAAGSELAAHGYTHIPDSMVTAYDSTGEISLFGMTYSFDVLSASTVAIDGVERTEKEWFAIGAANDNAYLYLVADDLSYAKIAQYGLGTNYYNGESEWWGSVSFQQGRMNSALVIFNDIGIYPKTFFAPYHGFDHNTYIVLNNSGYYMVDDEPSDILHTALDNSGNFYPYLVQTPYNNVGFAPTVNQVNMGKDTGVYVMHKYGHGEWHEMSNVIALINFKNANPNVWFTTDYKLAKHFLFQRYADISLEKGLDYYQVDVNNPVNRNIEGALRFRLPPGKHVSQVYLNGTMYRYFIVATNIVTGEEEIIVDLPELSYGENLTAEVEYNGITSSDPYINEIDYIVSEIDSAMWVNNTFSVSINGTSSTYLNIQNLNKSFLNRTTEMNGDGSEKVFINNLSGQTNISTVDLSITPSADSVTVTINTWNTSGTYYKKWTESSASSTVTTSHIVGDLGAGQYYQVKVDGAVIENLQADDSGQIIFTYSGGYCDKEFEVEELPRESPADFNQDCDVDFADFSILAFSWLTEDGQAGWNPNCDIAIPADGVIDGKDLGIFMDNWLLGH